MEFHLYLVNVIVMEMNYFTFNVQQFNKKIMNLFWFFFKWNIFLQCLY